MRWKAISTPFAGAKNKGGGAYPGSQALRQVMRHLRVQQKGRGTFTWHAISSRGEEISWSQAHTAISTSHTITSMRCGASKGHMTRIARSFPGAKSRAGHVFRVEASCKFAAGQGGKSKKGLCFIVKSILMLALHAVAGAGAAYPGTY